MPYQLVRQRLELRATATTIEVYRAGKRVATHAREYGRRRYVTDPAHMPASHRAHAEWTPSRLIRWAETVSADTATLVEKLLASRPHPEHAYRACLGIMSLAKRYGNDRVGAACARALTTGAISYSSVKSILAEGLDRLPSARHQARGRSAHPRQPARRPLLGRRRGGLSRMLAHHTIEKLAALGPHCHGRRRGRAAGHPRAVDGAVLRGPPRPARRPGGRRPRQPGASPPGSRRPNCATPPRSRTSTCAPREGSTAPSIASLANATWVAHGHNLVLTGPTGVGKSCIACALANAAVRPATPPTT